MSGVYTYLHAKPDGTVFYVGKGTRQRAFEMSKGRRNTYHHRVTSKVGKQNVLIGLIECSSSEIAFKLEKGLIKLLRAQGAVLCNHTDGGEGGLNPSHECREKHSEIMQALFQDPDYRAKHSAAIKKAMQRSEDIEKRRASQKLVQARGGNRAMVGRCWLTNGTQNIFAKPEEVEGLLSKGWYKGRVCG